MIGHVLATIGGAAFHPLTGPVSRTSDYVANYVLPNMMPSVDDVFNMVRFGLMPEENATVLLRSNGVYCKFGKAFTDGNSTPNEIRLDDMWNRAYQADMPQPSVYELIELWNRNVIGEGDFRRSMERQGWRFRDEMEWYKALKDQLPVSADLVRFAVRHVFEPDLIEKFGYNDELRDAFIEWHQKLGFGYDARSQAEQNAGRAPYTWAHAHWWSHWVLPSPGQGYEMLQRLRPTGGPQGGPRDSSGQTFSPEDMKLLLRANDYPPFWRDKLLAVSYRPIGLRQINQLVKYGLTDRNDLLERWQDIGYSQQNAEVLADLSLRAEDSRKFKQQTAGIRSRVISAYEVGTISRNDAEMQLYRLSLESSEDASEFDSLPPSEQLSLAADDPAIGVALDTVELDIVARQAKSAISAIKRQFVSGKIGEGEARSRLTGMGILDSRVTGYLAWWGNQLDVIRRELSASQVVKFTREGLISPSDAANRLINLGYGQNDAYIISRDIQRDIEMDMARAAKAAARTEQQREEALIRQAKAAVTAHKSARSELARHGSPTKLAKWLKDGLIGEDEVTLRLAAMDWPQADIDRLIAEAEMPPKAKASAGSTTSGAPQ